MKKAIIGKKIGMTQIFNENGKVVPVTVIEAGPCVVLSKKTKEKHGYSAVQFGYGSVKSKNLNRPQRKFFEKLGQEFKKKLLEFRFNESDNFNVGDIISVDIFSVGDSVDVVGTSKGKGWAGVIKRWNFRRLKESHGSGPVVRKGGSIGACSDPSRVFKGMKSAGRLGFDRVTIQNLKVVKICKDKNLIALKGSIPGPSGSIIHVKDSVKVR
ncbi:MAG: 50S ribosomal protein L3 [Firmicutes bacterium]|nr:50S ribosomal protein L3 [Bacillota bacterium]